MRTSRWSPKQKVRNGQKVGREFRASDLEVCRLLSYARTPWGYKNLPTNYFPILLKRGEQSVKRRLTRLCEPPSPYLFRPPQAKNNFRPVIHALDTAGIQELEKHGYETRFPRAKVTAHQLLVDLTKASFEIGGAQHNLIIEPSALHLDHVRPDHAF